MSWHAVVAEFFELRPEELEGLSGVLDDASCWFAGTEFPGTAVIHVPIPNRPRMSAFFARAPAGAALALHRHEGIERVLVLRGGYTTSDGVHVGVGEILVCEAGTEHALRMDNGEECIVAARIDFTERPKAGPLDKGVRVVPEGGSGDGHQRERRRS